MSSGRSRTRRRSARTSSSESLALSALLVLLGADAENAASSSTLRALTTSELEPHASEVLDRMAASADPQERGELLDDLYDAVVDVVGERASETIAALPAPGHWEPVTFSQWVRAVRAGSLSGRVAWRGLVIAAVFIVAWLLVGGWVGVALGMAGFAVAAGSFPRLWIDGWRWPLFLIGAAYGVTIASNSLSGHAEVLLAAAGASATVAGFAAWAIVTRQGRPADDPEETEAGAEPGGAARGLSRPGGNCFIRMVDYRGDQEECEMVNFIGPYPDMAEPDTEARWLNAMPGVDGEVMFVAFHGNPADADRVMAPEQAATAAGLDELDGEWTYKPGSLGLQIVTAVAEPIPVDPSMPVSGAAGSSTGSF